MAKATRSGGKRAGKQTESGPVLVDEEPEASPAPIEEEPKEEIIEDVEEELDPRRVPPAASLDNNDSPKLWPFLKQHPDPGSCDLYGYRLFPVIKIRAPDDWVSQKDPPTHIFKLKGLITPETNRIVDYEWLRDTWGSGKYEIRLIDRRLKRNQNRQICRAILDVNEWNTHIPVLGDWSELLPVTGNKWVIEMLVKDKVIKRNPDGGFMAYEPAPQQNNAGDAGALIDKTFNVAEKLAKAMQPREQQSTFTGKDIVDLIGKTQAANDPQKIIDAAKGLVEISKPGEDKEGNMMMKFVLDRLAAAEERSSALLDKLLSKQPEPAPAPLDPIKQVEQTAKLATTLKEAFGPSESETARTSKMGPWQEFGSTIVGHLSPGLNALFQGVGMFIQIRGHQVATPQPPARPGQPPATQVAPMSQQQPGQPPPAPQPGQQPTVQPDGQPPTPAQQNMAELYALLYQMKETLITYLENPNDNGTIFAEWFCTTGFGIPIGTNPITGQPITRRMDGHELLPIARQYGAQAIIEAYKSSPWWQDIAPTPAREQHFEKFVEEFLAYDPEAAEAKEEGQQP